MQVLLIVNTAASSVTARTRVVIQKALGADHDLEVAETARQGHAARLARGAAAEGVDVVAVLGGDGTLNEAADGLMGSETALAPLPGGSTNVYARTIGLANDPIEATAQLLAALDRKSFRRIGLGVVEGRPFLFNCGIGFDAAVIETVERRAGPMKRYAAHPLFILAALDTWLRSYDRRHMRFELELDGHERVDRGMFAIVHKTSPYTFLGARPLVVAPDAGLDTPLAVTVFRSHRTPTMLLLSAYALFAPGRIPRHRSVVHREGIRQIKLTSDRPVPYQLDGEFLGEVTELSLHYEPDALTLVVP